MKTTKFVATYRRLREQPLWRLLAADKAPIIISLLQTYLFESKQSIPASILHERISRELEELRPQGEELPQTAQAYIAAWLADGYLERRFPAGAAEEEYELSAAATSAIRFISSLVERRTTATESRLATVIQQLVRLAEETDPNPQTRIATLLAEKQRIEREIEAVQQGRLQALPEARALERIREIIVLADELVGDFRHVRDQFERLNRDFRTRIMEHDGSRGEVLTALFAGVDVIAGSDAGRTFAAFWRLLTDPEQSATLEEASEHVLARTFAQQLEMRERHFLLHLTNTLLDQGGVVHEVWQHFARSLKQFVQSREYLEQRRLNQLLSEAQRAALALKDELRATDNLHYTLQLTGSRLRSLAQWALYDPTLQACASGMTTGAAAPISLATISEWVAQSEIDLRTLKANIRAVLAECSQASIAEIMIRFPATQGLGSVVGYLALGSRHGLRVGHNETVIWQGKDDQCRSARIPTIYFLRARINELA